MRSLTDPVQTVEVDTQYVSAGKYKLVPDGAGGINMDQSYYQYTVTSLPSEESTSYKIKAQDLPLAFRSKLKTLHQMVVAHAENQGLLLPGNDSDDL